MSAVSTALMTAEEFFEWANRPENAGTRYELEDGRVIELPSPGYRHGLLCSWIAHLLWNFAIARGRGRVASNDTGLVVRRNPDTTRGADVMFFDSSPPLDEVTAGYPAELPVLVVEVRSPSDRDNRILRRVEQYHRRGVPLVWLVDPEEHVITVYTPNEFPRVHDETDELTGNGVLPDFRCRVADLFTLPGQPSPPPTA